MEAICGSVMPWAETKEAETSSDSTQTGMAVFMNCSSIENFVHLN
jgi:hypothetical protein